MSHVTHITNRKEEDVTRQQSREVMRHVGATRQKIRQPYLLCYFCCLCGGVECSVVQRGVLQDVAGCCRVLQCVAAARLVSTSVSPTCSATSVACVVQCGAVWCSVVQCGAAWCVARYCRVLQGVAAVCLVSTPVSPTCSATSVACAVQRSKV